MDYQLIALDLDNTLLNSDNRITAECKAAVRRAQDAGVQVVLASGRAYPGVEPFRKELGVLGYSIVCAGAQVVDPWGKVIHSTYLSRMSAKQVMRWAAVRGVYFQVFCDHDLYFLSHNKYAAYYEKLNHYQGMEEPDLLDRDDILASKIVLIDEPENLDIHQREMTIAFPELDIKRSDPMFLDILNPEASKGSALEFLSNKLGIDPHQMIAVGDSEIDVSMFQVAGLGIAVANAEPHVRQEADAVCASNDENGVAQAIDQYIFGGN